MIFRARKHPGMSNGMHKASQALLDNAKLIVALGSSPDSHSAPTLPPVQKLKRGLQIVLACASWMAASSGLILVNKHIMVDLGFKFPITVAALGMISSSLLCMICCKVFKLFPLTRQVSTSFYLTRVMPVGLFMAVTFVTGNTGYLYLTVAFVQMLKAFCPIVTMLLLFVSRLEIPTNRLIASVCVIAGGLILSSYGELHFSGFGVTAMSISVISESVRLVMVQQLLTGQKFTPMEGIYYMAPACSIWLALLVLLKERNVITTPFPFAVIQSQPLLFGMSCIMGFAVNVTAFLVIKLSSSLTLKVLGSAKDALLVVVGVVFLHEAVTGIQAFGYVISLLGFAWYNVVKFQSSHKHMSELPSAVDTACKGHDSAPSYLNVSPKIRACT